MIELAFVVCLSAAPARCEERRLAYLPDIGLKACMVQAPLQLAKWIEAHPHLKVARWTCELADPRGAKA